MGLFKKLMEFVLFDKRLRKVEDRAKRIETLTDEANNLLARAGRLLTEANQLKGLKPGQKPPDEIIKVAEENIETAVEALRIMPPEVLSQIYRGIQLGAEAGLEGNLAVMERIHKQCN